MATKIRFLRDYRGTRTENRYYTAGLVTDRGDLAGMVAEGIAEWAEDDAPCDCEAEDITAAERARLNPQQGMITGISAIEAIGREAQREAARILRSLRELDL